MRVCKVKGCRKMLRENGYCTLHYQRWRRHGDPLIVREVRTICSIEGCGLTHQAKGYCADHYYAYRRYGDPLAARRSKEKTCRRQGCQKPRGKTCEGYCLDHYRTWRIRQKKCRFPKCARPSRYKNGFCRKHYYRSRRYGDPDIVKQPNLFCTVAGCRLEHYARGKCYWHYLNRNPPAKIRRCIEADCDRMHWAKGFCRKHYIAWRKHGFPSLA